MKKNNNEFDENCCDEELGNNKYDEYDEYDEYDFPVTNIKGSSYYGLTMHKLKYDYDYWCRLEEENPSESNFRKKFIDKHFKKSSLIEHSLILQDYQKITTIKNFLKKFYLDCGDTIKLEYRASEDKEFLFENFIKAYLNSKNRIIIMKTSINMYFIKTFNFPEYKWSNNIEDFYIFYTDKFMKLDDTNLIIKKDNKNGKPQFELSNYFSIFNSYNSGKLLKSKKNNQFSIVEAEIFSLYNKKFDDKFN